MSSFDHWRWNWSDVCPSGLQPWIPNSNDLAPCFQQIFLQLPLYVLLAVSSSYYFGSHYKIIVRDKIQRHNIMARIVVTLVLAIIPIFKLFYLLKNDLKVYPIDVLLSCTQFLAWFVHIGYLYSLKKSGSLSHRGPLIIIVLWTSLSALSTIWLHTNYGSKLWGWAFFTMLAYLGYGATLVRVGNSHSVRVRRTEEDERAALLSNSYVRFQDDIEESVLGPAQDGANILSKLIFYWVNPLINKGEAGKLKKNDDLFDLPECLNILKITEQFQTAIRLKATVFKALHKCFGLQFYTIGLLRLLADLSGFAGPLLLGGLLSITDDPNNEIIPFDKRPYYYAFGLFAATLLSTFAGTHFNWKINLIGMKMRTGLVTAIYRKALDARGLENARPEILNLMSTDTDRIVNSCISFHSFWSIPFQLFTTLYLLYTQLGIAFISGVIFSTALIPINRYIAVKIAELSQGLMTAKDGRVSVTSELLSGAKHIKINAWEDVFINKIDILRKEEVKFLSKRKYLDALCVYFWATTPVLMCLLTFGTSVLMGQRLTAATTYTSVALLNMLIGPLNAFPWVLNGLAEAWVSLKRVQELIALPNINLLEYYKPMTSDDKRSVVLSIESGGFEFETQRSRSEINLNEDDIIDFKFEDINLEIRKGELICLEGPFGGGKSSLLNVILANLKCRAGSVAIKNVKGGFGYVSQAPWLQRGTIRDNILWGQIFDEKRYNSVVHACALQPDFEILRGDSTGVGEQGRTLSGGQKARVALARAIYQNKDIYLLDDILSALDAHVASHVIKNCLFGLLKNKTRIIVTQNPTVLNQATQILHVENGIVSNSDIMNELSMISTYDDDDEPFLNMQNQFATINLERESQDDDDQKSLDSILMDESREFGRLDNKIIGSYWSAMTTYVGLGVLLSVILMQVSRNLTDAWLAHWVGIMSSNSSVNNFTIVNEVELSVPEMVVDPTYWEKVKQQVVHILGSIFGAGSEEPPLPPLNLTLIEPAVELDNIANNTINNSTYFYLAVYTGLTVTNSMITLVRAFLFAFAGIKACKCIHDKLLNSVMLTKMQFFDITPLGRILNRFSSDVYTIDDSLPFIMNILLAQFFGLMGALGISLYAMPWLGFLVIPLCPIYLNLQNKYRHSSRDIRRLSSNALSPLYAHFTETLQGLFTIRAMRGESRFRRDFLFKLEESLKAQLSASAAQQWLGLRLQLLGSVLVGGAGILAAITSAHASSPEFVGLAISYALSITSLLSGLLNAVAETEQEFVAVERVNQYCCLEKEVNADGSANPPFGWPYQGVVTLNDVYLKYRDHLPYALSGISTEITSCERVGIVGRTGAGKSSIIASLLRAAPLTKGTITIDCVNIATLPLDVLRSRVAVVPQEAFLFSGTVRENLDPRKLHLDTEIWDSITSCLASPLVQSLGGLNAKLEPGGSNLSAGQKQLLCLTRALLKKSKVVLIDEGTANLDFESEIAIQLVLKNAFKSRTVILIAHRLNGLQNTDRILVMQNGEIIEEGTPYNLSNNSESCFYSMLQEQQNNSFRNF